ncbi:MAG: CBS domain-containing protein [Anaerolineales bacterium]|jgi:CBS domain-containing protein/sporulation protein YlmC with PRC-barrel domain
MVQNEPITRPLTEQAYFLSEILGVKVTIDGKKIGKLNDVVIKENGSLPVVTYFVVSRPYGESALIPWDAIRSISPKEVILNVDDIVSFTRVPDENAVLLRDHILDKKAIDMDGREMEVVYDVKLVLKNNKLYVSEVDLSRYGLLRRMGLTRLANYIYRLAEGIREQTVSWTYIQPLPENIGSFRGNLQFKVVKEKLADLHPVDLADILEEMDPDQRVEVMEGLDPEQASDTLEEINPNVQRDLVESMKVEKVAQLIDQMTTGQAADVLSVLSASEANEILKLLDPANAVKIRAIMEHHEENILDFATQEYVSFPPDYTVEKAQDEYRTAAKGKDVVMYIYVLDQEKRLLGVIDIKELLLADDKALLKDVMEENVHSLDPDSTLKEAYEKFGRYDYRAIPISDDDYKLLGVVTYRDIVGLKHRFVE